VPRVHRQKPPVPSSGGPHSTAIVSTSVQSKPSFYPARSRACRRTARSQGRRRGIEKSRFTSSTSFRLGFLDLTGLALLGWEICLPDRPDPRKPSRSQRPKIGKRIAFEVHTDKRSAINRRSTRRSAEWNARYENGPSLKRLRLVLSVVSLGM
jgi:hypothetical protein